MKPFPLVPHPSYEHDQHWHLHQAPSQPAAAGKRSRSGGAVAAHHAASRGTAGSRWGSRAAGARAARGPACECPPAPAARTCRQDGQRECQRQQEDACEHRGILWWEPGEQQAQGEPSAGTASGTPASRLAAARGSSRGARKHFGVSWLLSHWTNLLLLRAAPPARGTSPAELLPGTCCGPAEAQTGRESSVRPGV